MQVQGIFLKTAQKMGKILTRINKMIMISKKNNTKGSRKLFERTEIIIRVGMLYIIYKICAVKDQRFVL